VVATTLDDKVGEHNFASELRSARRAAPECQSEILRKASAALRALIRKRELREHFEPSNPLMAGGANVRPLLIAAHP
jgi:hypothetical protein